jgi:hypothetical protein
LSAEKAPPRDEALSQFLQRGSLCVISPEAESATKAGRTPSEPHRLCPPRGSVMTCQILPPGRLMYMTL